MAAAAAHQAAVQHAAQALVVQVVAVQQPHRPLLQKLLQPLLMPQSHQLKPLQPHQHQLLLQKLHQRSNLPSFGSENNRFQIASLLIS